MNNLLFILLGIKQSLQTFAEWLVTLGPLGLFAISLIDSAGLPLPGGPDAVMILLSARSHALVPLYAIAASLGSTIGCAVMYSVARRAGMLALRKIKPARRARIENLLGRYDMLAIMATAILPPPFPFKPFVLSAGVFKLKRSRFIIAVFTGRLVRFTMEGLLAIAFGEAAGEQIKRHGLKVLLVVVVAATLLIVFNILRSRRARTLAAPELQPPIE
ncbi:MAG TPA: VTT domain-containing protein [Blastocatellia bacterium]